MTDEEVFEEMATFQENIHKVSLRSRYCAWISMMILLIIGLLCVYISFFAHLYEDDPS